MCINEKKQIYSKWIARLREDKIEETKKKFRVYGYMDEDDYHFLAPPEWYDWKPVPNHKNCDFHGYTAWAENYKAMTESFPPVVVPYSSMAGNFYKILHKYRKLRWNPDYPFTKFEPLIELYNIDHCIGQVHHFSGDIKIGFELGWGGLLEKVRKYAAVNAKDTETQEFYSSEETLVLSIIQWIKRTSECIAEKLEKETDLLLRENLRDMLEANRWVETNPPRTMREACQFMCWYNIVGRSYNREGCGGQLDELLYPYYKHDIDNNLIDDEDAVFYIVGVLLSDTKYYQLGGPDKDGNDIVNELSWLILEAADRLNITLNLTVRVHNKLDRAFFQRTVELLFKHKSAWPRFSGDDSLVSGFVNSGFSKDLARERIAVGCNWMAIPGKEYCLNDSLKLNLAKVFQVAFDEVLLMSEPSTKALWELFVKHLKIALNVMFKTTDFHVQTNRYNSPELFLNLFCYGPIEKGRDASDHSLEFYNIGLDGAGIAVVADSFAALEQRIEKEKRVTWIQVANAVRCNYSSPSAKIVQKWMQTAEKYGQYNSLGLKWARRIAEIFTQLASEGHSDEGIKFIPGLFSWSKTILFGQNVGATPDGRHAGAPINHGANPMPGSVKNGELTTMSEAIIAVQSRKGNTTPFQMELDPSISAIDGGIDKIMALLETHLSRGGTLINVNIVDAEKICAAHANPELYPDLIVRVTGFTAYFSTLSPEFRQLVVDRIIKAQ